MFICTGIILGIPVQADQSGDPVNIHILAINDLHGQITPGQKINNISVGGAPVIGAYLSDAIKKYGKNRTVIALPGDMTGASPAESGLLLDEPTVIFLNMYAGDGWREKNYKNSSGVPVIATLGNHEFDRNVSELMRLINGGDGDTNITHIVDPYPGMMWPVVASNVYHNGTGDLLVPPYTVQMFDSIPVAFIGAVTTETAHISKPGNVASLRYADEAGSINDQVEDLKKQGIHAFVVLIHEGGDQVAYAGPTTDTGNVSGRISEIVPYLDEDVDLVVSGHTHKFTDGYLKNKGNKSVLVTQAYSYGQGIADISLSIDPVTRDITNKTATIVPTYADRLPGSIPDPDAEELLTIVDETVDPLINETISRTEVPLTRDLNPDGESDLYDLVSDSMRDTMGTDIAFINTGAVRADVPAGNITLGTTYSLLPFNDQVLILQMNGTEIHDVLDQQWNRTVKPDHMLQVSGLSYSYDPQKTEDRINAISVNNTPLVPDSNYTVAIQDFLAYGGDGYSVFTRGKQVEFCPLDVEALQEYLKKNPSPIKVNSGGRITKIHSSP